MLWCISDGIRSLTLEILLQAMQGILDVVLVLSEDEPIRKRRAEDQTW
jgi:hypothetical protein